jgi:AraC-like DNA-binding protein
MKVAEEFLGDSEFSAEQFSREVGLSRMQLHRKLVALTDQTTSDFLRTIRLKRAAQLLEAQMGNISEIAYSVGFSSLSYFSKSFRDHFGVQPTEYALRHASSTQE